MLASSTKNPGGRLGHWYIVLASTLSAGLILGGLVAQVSALVALGVVWFIVMLACLANERVAADVMALCGLVMIAWPTMLAVDFGAPWPLVSGTRLALLTALVVGFIRFRGQLRVVWPDVKVVMWGWFVLSALGVASAIWSVDKAGAVSEGMHLMEAPLGALMLAVVARRGPVARRRVVVAVGVGLAISALFALYQSISGTSLWSMLPTVARGLSGVGGFRDGTFRAQGLFWNAIAASVGFAMALLCSWGFLRRQRSPVSLAGSAGMVILMALALRATGSRTGWVAAAVGVAVYLLVFSESRNKAVAFLLGVVIFAGVLSLATGYESDLVGAAGGYGEYASAGARLIMVDAVVERSLSNPASLLIGGGMGEFGSLGIWGVYSSGPGLISAPDNDYARVLAELGLAGLGAMTFLYWSIWRSIRRTHDNLATRHWGASLYGVFSLFCVAGLSFSGVGDFQIVLLLLLPVFLLAIPESVAEER